MSEMGKKSFIEFTVVSRGKHKTGTWRVSNRKNGDDLGLIAWYPAWRQYCFLPTLGTVFSSGCLDEIMDFINNAMKEK